MTKFVALPPRPMTSFDRHDRDAGPVTKPVSTIAIMDEGEQVPAFQVLPADNAFPVDVSKLTQNIASMLNGNTPPHALKSDGALYYQRLPHGISFYFRQGGDGVSKIGLTVIASDREPTAEVGAAIEKMDSSFMKQLCDGIQMKPVVQTAVQPKTPAP